MGGALNNDDGGCLLFVSGSTIVANSTDRGSISGGGIQNASSLVLSNSILSGNTDGSSGADDLSDFGIGGNFFDGTNVVAGNLVGVYDGNPANGESVGLSPLGHYGGPTETMLPEPGSAAICGGLKSGIPAGTTKDQRGFAITNTTYSGYSSTAPCVDSGAVQTHYALRFNIQPSPISPDLSIQPGTNFRAGAKVTESSLSVTMPVTVALTLNGPGNLSGGAATTVSGEASYSALQIDTAGTGDALTATLTLNGSIALTASSSSFDVAASGPPFGWMLPVKDVTTGGTSGVAQADQLVVSGTAADPQDGTPVRQVQILIDGSAVDNATLGLASTGLQASYNNSAYARGGWSFTEPASALSAGTHTVSAVASDSLGQSTTIGTETFVVSTASSGPPVGWMFPVKDATTGGTGAVGQADNLSVSGTAGDPHDGTPVVQVQILIDGFAAGTATLNLASTGLEAAYNNPAYAHGGWNFAQPASGLSLGTHTLRAVASDSLGLSTVLGTETFTVAAVSSGPPVGWMFPVEDATTNSTSTVNVLNDLRVKGVAGDPHDGAPVEQVQILIDGAAVGTATLGLASPGLEATYSNPAYGEGGWTFTSAASNLSLGTHTIAAIATDSLNLSTTLGTGTFTVVASSGSLGSYQIDAWGDSLTQGNEDGTQITYPKKLAALTGQTVHAYGVGAQTSSQIAVRMNAYAGKPEQTFAAGFTIPTSGTVNVVFQTGFEPVNTEYLPAYGKSGVPVSFVVAGQSYSGSVIEASGAWIFTPDTYPTTAVSVPAGTAWLTVLSSGTNNGCVVIWAGRNNYTNGAQVQADIAAMVATVRQSTNCYLVMSIPNGEYSNEWKGRPAYNTIIALNSALSATYSPGNHYLDIRADLINMYNPAIPADVLDHMIDVWPYSLRAKDVSGSLTAALDSPTSCAISASVALGNGTILSENGELIKITGGSNGSYTCVRGYAGTTPETDPDGDLFTGVDALHLGQNADSPLNPNFTNGYSAVAAEVYAWLQANGSV